MNFPGDNEIRLSHDTVLKIIGDHVRSLVGDEARIVRITSTSSYGSRGMTIDFTTDPPPAAPEPKPAAPVQAEEIATPRNAEDEPL